MLNALSIDVEEYFQVSAFESVIPRDDWQNWPSRVAEQTHRLLDLFDTTDVKATFFTLGWVAERHPGLIRRIIDDGHELACHGYEHVRITAQTPATFREDLRKTKTILEDIAGRQVNGFRAASFSINRDNEWAFTEIEAAGFEYSSSIYPVKHDLYGIPDAPRVPHRAPGCERLFEIPVTTARFGARNVPAGGGGYFRLLPYTLSRALISRVNLKEAQPANMYFHPWEFDPGQPRPKGAKFKARFRHYLNQDRAFPRLQRLLSDFEWGSFEKVYAPRLAMQ